MAISQQPAGFEISDLGEDVSGRFILILCPYDFDDLPDLVRVFFSGQGFNTTVDVHRAGLDRFYRPFYILPIQPSCEDKGMGFFDLQCQGPV